MRKILPKQRIGLILLGVFLCIVLLEIGLRLGGFIFLSLQEYRNRVSIREKGTYRIMCLGESTTAVGGEDSYPRQLEEVLNQRDLGIRFSVINKGVPGTNTALIASVLEDNLNRYNPDMVTAMMGINDDILADVVAYQDTSDSRITLFLKSLKTYKLAKLIQLHIINKAQEIGIYRPKEIRENIPPPSNDLTQLQEQEGMLKEAVEINPKDDGAYFQLGRCYLVQGYYAKAEEMLKKAIEINPGNDLVYIKLGWCYYFQEKYSNLEEVLKKAIQINPKNYQIYFILACYYKRRKRYDKVEEILKKAIEINPRNPQAYIELAGHYKNQREHNKVEETFKKAIEIEPGEHWTNFELGGCYLLQGKYDKSEEALKKAIEINPRYDAAYGALAHCYQDQGRHRLAEEYFDKANRLRLERYNSITRQNYQRLKEILDKRGIKLVCMQYPMRSIEPLKRLFDSTEGMIFVDNEGIFKEAIRQASYDEYFTDIFGGDFGHCTPKGNRLLAENIADVILRECF